MPSNWPTSLWNPQSPLADDSGMVPFSIMDPGTAVLQSHGVTHDVYLNYSDTIYSSNNSGIRAWDVMENPLYQAMAEYEGYDWPTLVNQFNEDIGPIEAQPHRILIRNQGAGIMGGSVTQPGGYSPSYETFDNYADAVAWADANDYDVSDIELAAEALLDQPTDGTNTQAGMMVGAVAEDMASGFLGLFGGGGGGDERYWGITDQTWIDRFNDWTGSAEDLINMFERQDAPIIRRGPSAADYGIVRADNNIFAHYGLDRPPADPKELATNYIWNLSKTWTSDVSYAVPPDLKRVNLSGSNPNPIVTPWDSDT